MRIAHTISLIVDRLAKIQTGVGDSRKKKERVFVCLQCKKREKKRRCVCFWGDVLDLFILHSWAKLGELNTIWPGLKNVGRSKVWFVHYHHVFFFSGKKYGIKFFVKLWYIFGWLIRRQWLVMIGNGVCNIEIDATYKAVVPTYTRHFIHNTARKTTWYAVVCCTSPNWHPTLPDKKNNKITELHHTSHNADANRWRTHIKSFYCMFAEVS